MKKSLFSAMIVICVSIVLVHADDTEIFMTQMPPDALIILDMSGSMNWDPAGNPAAYPNRRIDIARDVLNDLLDNNGDNKIDARDERSLNIRLGYMRFRDIGPYDNDDNEPTTGKIRVLSEIGSAYKTIWDQISNPAETAVGATPLAASLAEARTYFQRDVNPADPAIACREKFIILLTDGADTVACNGSGSEDQTEMNRRRMLTVQRAKELRETGIKVFAVGFGETMPEHLKRTLNWVAKYGGTDNPLETNSGNPGAYDITRYGAACSLDATHVAADPASYPLSGYAFLAKDASQLREALRTIARFIQEKSLSFTAPTIPSVRIIDKDMVYISSFIPNETPFWKGNLKAYRLNDDGTLPVDGNGNPLTSSLVWDAFERLKDLSPESRNIYTVVNGQIEPFDTNHVEYQDLELPDAAEAQRLIGHIRGIDTYDINQNGNTTEARAWKLGDIFHSNAVIVGEPSRFFEDEGFSGPTGFYQTHKNRPKVVIVGANDGMLHAFDAGTGDEQWAFIPNSLLKTLKFMISTHTYYVDSSPKVADVWLPSATGDTTKSADEWRTVLICGLRKGGRQYFALDITDTLHPRYLWEFPKASDVSTLAKMGESWSEPFIGRVKIEEAGRLVERWVAFIGGGFDYTNVLGRAFFVVDIKTGDILWEFSYQDKVAEKNFMDHALAAPATGVDLNDDGFIDRVYIGDLGGQMWVFDVSFNAATQKSNSQWSGKRLFKAPATPTEKHSIYYPPAVAFDQNKNPWVYFGTGNREFPKEIQNPPERFYAIRDDGLGTYPRTEDLLSNVTFSNTYNYDSTKQGWYIQLEKSGDRLEKVLAKPAVFNRLVYFTTFTYIDTGDPCNTQGIARLYVVEYLSGGGAISFTDQTYAAGMTSQRAVEIGTGIPSSPVISINLKGQAIVIIGTTSGQVFSQQIFSPSKLKNLLYWRRVYP